MKNIQLGWSCNLVCTDAVAAQLLPLLVQCTKEDGDTQEFTVKEGIEPAVAKQKKEAEEFAKAELEKQEKNWMTQYNRVQELQKELQALKDAQASA